VLRHLPRGPDADVLLGANPADDAAVYRLSDQLALVQTVDFFTPVVDDPYDFGRIAVANALSDVYAVGGRPSHALNIVGFPIKSLPIEVLSAILTGGADMAAEAGISIVGGHTVDDEEPKYGLSVTGTVDPASMVTTRGARPGDVLILTKPLGTGTVTTALKGGAASAAHTDLAVRWMTTLNRLASESMATAGADACTDITGYGLIGHLADLCRASGVGATVSSHDVPLLPGAEQYAAAGHVPGGTFTNLDYLEGSVHWDDAVDEIAKLLLCDPQTSGGLLVCLPEDSVKDFERGLRGGGIAARIGWVTREGADTLVTVAA
jgi:selenide,water dikinase